MPSLTVKLYSIFFKFQQRYNLYNLTQSPLHDDDVDPFGITSRHEEPTAPSNPSFQDGIATKDIHIDPFSSLCVRIFLPDTVVNSNLTTSNEDRNENYGGYSPMAGKGHKRLPVMLQFHGGAFVGGSNDSVGNDAFCKRIAKLCDVIVVAVGYRLAPESRYPAAFEDGLKVLYWLGKQANLAECGRWMGNGRRRMDAHVFDRFGSSMVEPWLAAHGDPSRYVI